MRKYFKKPLIYLIAFMLVLPTWVVTGITGAQHAKAAAGPENVIINELMWAGNSSSSSDEWLELRNMTNSPIDLSGWTIENAATSMGNLTIPAGKTIPADSYLLIANYSKGSPNTVLDVVADWVTTSISLSDNPVQYVLRDETDNVIDIAGDGLSTPFSGSASAPISSMERNLVPGDGRLSGNWHTSVGQYNLILGATEFATPGFENDNTVPLAGVVKDGLGPDINFTNSTNTLSANWSNFSDNNLDHYKYAIGTTIGGVDIVSWTSISVKNMTENALVLVSGQTYYVSVKAIDKVGLESVAVSSDGQMVDLEIPVITLLGDNPLEINIGDNYIESGFVATDNLDSNIQSKVVVDSSLVDINTLGTYFVAYNVSDEAGNNAVLVTRTVNVVEKAYPTSPNFTISKSETGGQKTITISWLGVGGGVEGYTLKIDGITKNIVAQNLINDSGMQYFENINVADYGQYKVLVQSHKNGIFSQNATVQTVEFTAPKETTEPIAQVSAKPEAPVATVAPQSVVAAPEPTDQNLEQPTNDNGIIKGDENSNAETEESVNWTPWIVLFVLIILAGAATGGYFYWFNGSDEVASEIREPKGTERPIKKNSSGSSKNNRNKKAKRW